MKKLETQRLILLPLKADHAIEMYQDYCDKNLYTYLEEDVPESLDWLRKQFAIIEKGKLISKKGENLLLYDWVIYLKDEKKIIGRCEYTVYEDQRCNVAYLLFTNYWKKGFGYEAISTTIDYLVREKKQNQFEIRADSWNISSYKLATKLGFKFKETLPQVNHLKNRIGDDLVFELKF